MGNEHIFNQLTDHNLNLPDLFKRYKNTSPDSPFLTKKDIFKIFEKLEKMGKSINLDIVSKELGAKKSYFDISRNRLLMRLILDKDKTELSNYEQQIKEIIRNLKMNGKKISKRIVAEEMKIKPVIISENPELSQYFRDKKEMNPTYIPHILKAIEEIKEEKKKITKTEISRRAKISLNTINKYPELKRIVENAIKIQN